MKPKVHFVKSGQEFTIKYHSFYFSNHYTELNNPTVLVQGSSIPVNYGGATQTVNYVTNNSNTVRAVTS